MALLKSGRSGRWRKRSSKESTSGLSGQGRPRPAHQLIIGVAGTAEIEDTGGKVTVAPGWRDILIVLKHGGTEFIVVRVVSFQENQPASTIDEFPRIGVLLRPGEHTARGS